MDIKCLKCRKAFRIERVHDTADGIKQFFMCACVCEDVYAVTMSVVPVNLQDKAYRLKDILEELYTNRGMTMIEIGMQYGVSAMTINNWLRKHEIPTRRRGRPPIW